MGAVNPSAKCNYGDQGAEPRDNCGNARDNEKPGKTLSNKNNKHAKKQDSSGNQISNERPARDACPNPQPARIS